MTPALLTNDALPRLALDEWRAAGCHDTPSGLTPVSFVPGQRLRLQSGQVLRGAALTLPSLKSVFGNGTQGGAYGYKWGDGWIDIEGATNWLIEDCVFDFGAAGRYSHEAEVGYNAINVRGGASQGVIRRCTFKNVDSALFLRSCHHLTVEDCTVVQTRKSWQPDPTDRTGHYGVLLSTADHCLVSRLNIQGRLMHDVSVQNASYNVIEDATGVDLNFDHHRKNPHHNLFTGCNVGLGTRVYASSGNVSDGTNNGDWECFWGNYKADGSQVSVLPNFQNGYWTKRLVIIGQTQDSRTANAEWYENIPSDQLVPRNLYRHLVGATPPPPPPPPPFDGKADARERLRNLGWPEATIDAVVNP